MASGIRVLNHLEALMDDAIEQIDLDEEILYDVALDMSTGQPIYNFMLCFQSRLNNRTRFYTLNFPTMIPSSEVMIECIQKVIKTNDEVHRREAGLLHLN